MVSPKRNRMKNSESIESKIQKINKKIFFAKTTYFLLQRASYREEETCFYCNWEFIVRSNIILNCQKILLQKIVAKKVHYMKFNNSKLKFHEIKICSKGGKNT